MLEYLVKRKLFINLNYPLPEVRFDNYRLRDTGYIYYGNFEPVNVPITAITTTLVNSDSCQICTVTGEDYLGVIMFLVRYDGQL